MSPRSSSSVSDIPPPSQEALAAYDRVLTALGIKQEFEAFFSRWKLTEPWGSKIRSRWLPIVPVEVEPGVPLERHLVECLRAELTALLGDTKTGVGVFRDCTFLDFVGLGLFLAELLKATPAPLGTTGVRLIARLKAAADLVLCEDTLAEVVRALFRQVDLRLLRFNRLDRRILHGTLSPNSTPEGYPRVKLVVLCQAPQKEQVTFDGEPRPAYRCGQCAGPMGVRWVKWDGMFLGATAGRSYDVFVQSHAIDQLFKRLSCFDPKDGFLHEYLWRSLVKPGIIEGRGGQRLVEYRLAGHRFGYFTFGVLESPARIVLRTFLFLTMDGTPESDKLWKILRLQKDDKKWLRLDRPETFLFGNIAKYPDLSNALEECGCGHLLRAIGELPPEERPLFVADDIRRYVRMM